MLPVIVFSLVYSAVFAQDTQANGLYFTLKGNMYLPNKAVFIEDIGRDVIDRRNPGAALVCHSSNINLHCCRGSDNNGSGSIGDWFYPNNSQVISHSKANTSNNTFVRIGYQLQVRLVKRGNPTESLGLYRCEVPNSRGEIISASINILSRKSNPAHTTPIYTTPTNTLLTYTTPTNTLPTYTTPTITSTTFTAHVYSTPTALSRSTFSSGSNERTTAQEGKHSMSSGTTTVMSSTQNSSLTTIVVIIVIIIIVIFAIIAVVILIVLFRQSLGKWILPSTLRHPSVRSKSNQHSREINGNLPNDIFENPIPVATNGTQSSINLSEMHYVLDKSMKKNPEDGISESHNIITDMYAVGDESAPRDLIGIYESLDGPNAYAVRDQKGNQKANNKYETRTTNPNLSDMYAVVDKAAKIKANSPDEESISPNISEMYAVVDKTAKRNAKESIESLNSPNISDMYAVVDKKGNNNKALNEPSSQDFSEIYSVVK